MSEQKPERTVRKLDQRRADFEQTDEVAKTAIEQERAERLEKTAKLRALRLGLKPNDH
jgi:hypothetical protein